MDSKLIVHNNVNVSALDNRSLHDKIEELWACIQKIDSSIITQENGITLIIGDSGEGKSCLFNYLPNTSLVEKESLEHFGELVIENVSSRGKRNFALDSF